MDDELSPLSHLTLLDDAKHALGKKGKLVKTQVEQHQTLKAAHISRQFFQMVVPQHQFLQVDTVFEKLWKLLEAAR